MNDPPAASHGTSKSERLRLDLTRSRRLLEEALRGYRDLGDNLFVARTIGYLGYVALLRGDLPAARRLFLASLSGFRQLGERFGIAEEPQAISVLSAAEGQDGRAAELAGAAHALWDSMSAQPLASDRAIASGYLDAARRRTGRRSGDRPGSVGRRWASIRP